MKGSKKTVLAVLAAALIGCFGGVVSVQAAGILNQVKDVEWKQLYLTNRERIQMGEEPLSTFPKLIQAGQLRGDEQTVLYGHDRPNGSSCFTALDEKGISYRLAGENVAAGYSTPEAVTKGWMNSSGHRSNILYGGFTHLGVGYARQPSSYYGTYWAQLFIGSCSFGELSLCNAETGQVYGAGDVIYTKKGTALEELELAGKMRCSHGEVYFPLDSELCSGYRSDRAGSQKVTLKAYGMSVPFTVQVTAPLYEEKAPTLNRKMAGRKAVTLKWSAVKGAERYQLYRRTGKEGSFQKLAEITGTTYTDKKAVPGKLYYYRVRAVRGGETGRYSVNRSIEMIPEETVIKKAVPVSDRVTVTWEPAADADGYELWCKTGNGAYKRVRNLQGGSVEKANHFNLKKGQSYSYRVRAFWNYGGKRVCGGFSAVKKATV